MKSLKIAFSQAVEGYFSTNRSVISVNDTDFTDISAAVLSDRDAGVIDAIDETHFGIPVFVFASEPDSIPAALVGKVTRIIGTADYSREAVSGEIEAAAAEYEANLLPPFFGKLSDYMERNNRQFNCPGHQGGQYYRKHPAGRYFYDFYGDMIFKSDICNADVDMGDLLIHDGPPKLALKHASRVFHSDETYFVLNGTSNSNHVAIGAIVTPGDLVLFDRNNHKSVYDGALIQCGGTPIYLETARNPYGFIGGVDAHCFEEEWLRERIRRVDPARAEAERPFRLVVIQLGTYDGTIYNARQVVDRIGHLCDYILFDSAWVGYEQFIPMMSDCSPLLLELGPDDPGILVTQSVHKQQAGFSMASYVHKKDSHIKGQRRYVDQKRFNNSYRLHASTSPLYPLYASLDVNASLQDGEAGRRLWLDCLRLGVEARKQIITKCNLVRPFVPPQVYGKPWESYDTEEIISNIDFFGFVPGEKWHSYEGYVDNQYFVDPNKFMLTTPGIDPVTGGYEDFGVPATILASYMRSNCIVPEKNDFNSILFLMTPAETKDKMDALVNQLIEFEKCIKDDMPLEEALPYVYKANIDRYRGYTIRQLCQEMHDFYKGHDAKDMQKKLFREESFPEMAMLASEAQMDLVRGNAKLVRVDEIEGEIALEGALPYPPGIFCVVPGERWSKTACEYFLMLQEGINRFPGFSPEIHGVYLEHEENGVVAYGYVLDRQL